MKCNTDQEYDNLSNSCKFPLNEYLNNLPNIGNSDYTKETDGFYNGKIYIVEKFKNFTKFYRLIFYLSKNFI